MAMVQCPGILGHMYDSEKHASCPYCGVVGFDFGGPTTGAPPGQGSESPPLAGGTAGGRETGPTIAAGSGHRAPADRDPRTQWVGRERFGGIDPVVGWLVCIAGPDRGRDFRIHAERNHIGRDPDMDIVIPGDTGISRKHHAEIIYDPRRHGFLVAPGTSRGLAYVQDQPLLAAQPLAAYDVIEIGASKLLFVPLCGEHFTWPVEPEKAPGRAPNTAD